MGFVIGKLLRNLYIAAFPFFVLEAKYIKNIAATIIKANTKAILPVIMPDEKDIINECSLDNCPPSSSNIFSNIGNTFVTSMAITKVIIINNMAG